MEHKCKCIEIPRIKFSKENYRCIIPSKKIGDAGADLYADPIANGPSVVIKPLETKMIPTGIRAVIPEDYYAQIQERGSTGVKAMKYGAGVIDSSYRGVWNIVITNCSNKNIVLYDDTITSEVDADPNTILYPMTKAIAQFVLLPVPKVEIEEISPEEVLSNKTERMEGKLGSSGK